MSEDYDDGDDDSDDIVTMMMTLIDSAGDRVGLASWLLDFGEREVEGEEGDKGEASRYTALDLRELPSNLETFDICTWKSALLLYYCVDI
ncbi:hypothetical protein AJ79_00271 [Helicocarpus griseus UAMH5409]|uniref:Uncharacterized protein n=1 Tax=Helicocarpus griseus UAMH5409 TaxID=1447875 RepID=A0A2B7YD74_9EURO|nr:hypothetical protein AJ79_00271 [Helicocarpus griseus UAMH5409]